MIVLVTGSRTWDQPLVIAEALIKARDNPPEQYRLQNWNTPSRMVVRHGACPAGADAIAHEYAQKWGWIAQPYPAVWNLYGPAAGFIRNTVMVNDGADICLAFLDVCIAQKCAGEPAHYSHGTTHCADFAEAAGMSVRRHFACAPGDLEQRRQRLLVRPAQTPTVAP